MGTDEDARTSLFPAQLGAQTQPLPEPDTRGRQCAAPAALGTVPPATEKEISGHPGAGQGVSPLPAAEAAPLPHTGNVFFPPEFFKFYFISLLKRQRQSNKDSPSVRVPSLAACRGRSWVKTKAESQELNSGKGPKDLRHHPASPAVHWQEVGVRSQNRALNSGAAVWGVGILTPAPPAFYRQMGFLSQQRVELKT